MPLQVPNFTDIPCFINLFQNFSCCTGHPLVLFIFAPSFGQIGINSPGLVNCHNRCCWRMPVVDNAEHHRRRKMEPCSASTLIVASSCMHFNSSETIRRTALPCHRLHVITWHSSSSCLYLSRYIVQQNLTRSVGHDLNMDSGSAILLLLSLDQILVLVQIVTTVQKDSQSQLAPRPRAPAAAATALDGHTTYFCWSAWKIRSSKPCADTRHDQCPMQAAPSRTMCSAH